MTSTNLSEQASVYLHKLSVEIPERTVGSQGNRTATDFFARNAAGLGFLTECPQFDCIDWTHGDVHLSAGRTEFEAFASPFSPGCDTRAPLVVIPTVEALQSAEIGGKIVLLRGEIAREQLMPKNFTFYNPDHHKRIIGLLEKKGPAAIIAATGRDPQLAGAISPFPLFEDGDFNIPSGYMTEEEGAVLAKLEGGEITLAFEASRIPATGCNVIARKGGGSQRRMVVCAHIDAKEGTPGAIDNASGIVVLLLLAQLLGDYRGEMGIEIVAINGEDYYAASGEMQYIRDNQGKFDQIALAVNVDGAGYVKGRTAFSLYECPPEIEAAIRKVFDSRHGMLEGEPWYQSDHSIFIQNGVPALAITSEYFQVLTTEFAHTSRDRQEIVDCDRLVEIALALRALVLEIDRAQPAR
jgi:aminopeptidase YwaD